jgi:hypothetical protein
MGRDRGSVVLALDAVGREAEHRLTVLPDIAAMEIIRCPKHDV